MSRRRRKLGRPRRNISDAEQKSLKEMVTSLPPPRREGLLQAFMEYHGDLN